MSLARPSFIAVLLAVMVEELGIPMPTDVLIVFTGAGAGLPALRLGLVFVTLTVTSAVGASGLYAIVRRGGRPLIERFDRYVHLGPQRSAARPRRLGRYHCRTRHPGPAVRHGGRLRPVQGSLFTLRD